MHIEMSEESLLTSYTCFVHDSEQYPQAMSGENSKRMFRRCYCERMQAPAINLAWLRTCKQLYNETRGIPYRAICFEFDNGQSLQHFLTRSKRHVPEVRFLFLNICIPSRTELDTWVKTFFHMHYSLRELQMIRLDYSVGASKWRSRFPPYRSPEEVDAASYKDRKKDLHARFWQAILRLKDFPLRYARLTFDEYGGAHHLLGWTPSEQQSWIDYVQKKLVKEPRSDIAA